MFLQIDGGLKVNVGNNFDGDTHLGLEVNNIYSYDATNPNPYQDIWKDTEDSQKLIIASPQLIFDQEITMIVGGKNKALTGLKLVDHPDYPTIKNNEEIRLYLPNYNLSEDSQARYANCHGAGSGRS